MKIPINLQNTQEALQTNDYNNFKSRQAFIDLYIILIFRFPQRWWIAWQLSAQKLPHFKDNQQIRRLRCYCIRWFRFISKVIYCRFNCFVLDEYEMRSIKKFPHSLPIIAETKFPHWQKHNFTTKHIKVDLFPYRAITSEAIAWVWVRMKMIRRSTLLKWTLLWSVRGNKTTNDPRTKKTICDPIWSHFSELVSNFHGLEFRACIRQGQGSIKHYLRRNAWQNTKKSHFLL